MSLERFDVVIVGAGLSGIGVARYLKRELPGKTFAILETKPRMGGTWELFRYPGIRSDSDMHTMGYAFKPWEHPKAISEGAAILSYIKETASENHIDRHIRYESRVLRAAWSSANSLWTLHIEHPDGRLSRLCCRVIFSCAGYYDHHEGYLPTWQGYDEYEGVLVHPQFWPQNLGYAGKRVVIIGSGATAVTLGPALAKTAASVVQLQRSPSYVVSRASKDSFNTILKWVLPSRLAYQATRWRTILGGNLRARRMRKDPAGSKRFLIKSVLAEVGSAFERHFTPHYWPGQQRICRVPDGDMFKAIREKRLVMATDEIDRFDRTGIVLKSGKHLDADIVVTATGLVLQALGGIKYEVDGQLIDPARLLIYKGFMYSNVPNLIYFAGYFNASWTLKVDLVASFACRLLKHMDKVGAKRVVARADERIFQVPKRVGRFISGYVRRAAHKMPKMAEEYPFFSDQDYIRDRKIFLRSPVDDGTLSFSGTDPIALPPSQKAGIAPLQAAE